MRAIVSVTDKRNLVALKPLFYEDLVEFVSTGGTADALREIGIEVIPIEEVTGLPANFLGGRVKTLHYNIAAGILADRSDPEHMAQLEKLNIVPIDLVVVNLYDFAGNPDIEQIDIGGPTMLRSAAKNCEFVTAVVDPSNYIDVVAAIRQHDYVPFEIRRHLAKKVFIQTTAYDAAIAASKVF